MNNEEKPISIYPAVNEMVPKLLRVCPDFDPAQSAAKEPGVRRLMYDLGHYVIAKIEAGESASLAPLCATLEEVLDGAVFEVRKEIEVEVFMGCVRACGSITKVPPEPFVSQLGARGRQFYQETIDFYDTIGPLRYDDVY